MLPPIPKTKVDEVKDVINSTAPGIILSEFKYARCIRLLNDIHSFTPKDQVNMLKSIIELYAGNCGEAKILAVENYLESDDFQVLRNCAFIFQHVLALDLVVGTMGKISEISNRLGIDPKESLPPGYQLNYFLSGNLEKEKTYINDENTAKAFEQFRLIQQHLEITDESLIEVLQIVHNVVIENNIQCIFIEYSYIEEDFLLTIHSNKNLDEISKLNSLIAKRCYTAGLLDDLNKISYLFLPFDEASV